ncbi:hypothetical protein Tco_1064999, partial [Tanacetum coccineum]
MDCHAGNPSDHICDLMDKIGQLMIGSKEGTRSFGASNRLEDLESSFSYYKYKHPLTHKGHRGV